MSLTNVGTLNSTARLGSLHNLNATEPTDVFQFNLATPGNINLALKNISAGDDADLRLFRDTNGNGVFDASDRAAGPVASSTRGGNADDSINRISQSAGTYFAEVSRFAPGSSGDVSYDLLLSASSPSNLLPKEVSVGNLSGTTRNFSDRVDNTDTADTYHFSLSRAGRFSASLSGLSADADVRLIRDTNGNGIVDAGEVIASSTRGGNNSELLNASLSAGSNYFLEVYQFSGNTNYNLSMSAIG